MLFAAASIADDAMLFNANLHARSFCPFAVPHLRSSAANTHQCPLPKKRAAIARSVWDHRDAFYQKSIDRLDRGKKCGFFPEAGRL